MPTKQDRLVMKWIAAFGSLAVFLVVYGGFVRLTRAGLSITDWNPVGGAVPPLSQQAWQVEFSKYQETPEYLQINRGMTLESYREIFLIEWFHRLLARFAGLVFAVPFFAFLLTRRIAWKESGIYVLMGLLFISQAFMGWIMVASGLVDRPAVSHLLLAAHLFLALSLLGLSVWTFLGHVYGFPPVRRRARWSPGSAAALITVLFLLVQIAYGAFTAGLKAGHVSNTWPRMLGRWFPPGLLSQRNPLLLNLVDAPLTVAFIHRWLAFALLIVAGVAYHLISRAYLPTGLRTGLRLGMALGLLQIALGIAVIVSGVNIALALLHQVNALVLFVVAVYVLHRLRSLDQSGLPARSP